MQQVSYSPIRAAYMQIPQKAPRPLPELLALAKSITSISDEWRYTFMPEAQFRKLDPAEAGSVYWREMISRAEVVALTSAFKAARWIEARLHPSLCAADSCHRPFRYLQAIAWRLTFSDDPQTTGRQPASLPPSNEASTKRRTRSNRKPRQESHGLP